MLGEHGLHAERVENLLSDDVVCAARRFFCGLKGNDVFAGQLRATLLQQRGDAEEYLSGEITASRIAVPELSLTALRLEGHGVWDPTEQYWGEEDEPLPEYALRIIERGPRREYEMEQVLPGDDPDDPDGDPIIQSNDLKEQRDFVGARKILMQLLASDLRCLDAHAHLGNLMFDGGVNDAIRHYEIGMRIGELSLGAGFDGVLPWGWIDNRPFLRCMHGYGLCLWRVGRTSEAAAVFERMLWLNPSDNQGERFNLHWIREGRAWEDTVG